MERSTQSSLYQPGFSSVSAVIGVGLGGIQPHPFQDARRSEDLCSELRGRLVRIVELWISSGLELAYRLPSHTSAELPRQRKLHFTGFHVDVEERSVGGILVKSVNDFSVAFNDRWQRFIQLESNLSIFSCHLGPIGVDDLSPSTLQHPTLKEVQAILSTKKTGSA